MDFDDLLVNWNTLLVECPDVLEKLSDQFQYILVDEYQDTNKIQSSIVDKLASKHKNVLVVGDDAQSIYSFRAATISNILKFPDQYEGAKVFHLQTNYRSSPEILQLANQSIAKNRNQYEKSLKSTKQSAQKPVLIAARDSYQQAEFVCQRLLELRNEGRELCEMAVLFRSAFQMIELELELNKRNIPYVVRGGIRFFEQAHIKDVISYLKVVSNIKDDIAWMRLLGLWDGIGLVTAKKIIAFVGGYESMEQFLTTRPTLKLSARAQKSFERVVALFEKLQAAAAKDFIASSLKLILAQGYSEHVKNKYDNFSERLEDIEQLANFAVNYKTLDAFLSDVALSEGFRGEQVSSGGSEENDQLVLSTIHQAKGLEWRSVFLIGLAEGHFPHHKVYAQPSQLEEERRLFYVACTRAMDELFLLYPIFVSSYMTGEAICKPSSFIHEVDENCFEKWELESFIDEYAERKVVQVGFDDDSEHVIEYD